MYLYTSSAISPDGELLPSIHLLTLPACNVDTQRPPIISKNAYRQEFRHWQSEFGLRHNEDPKDMVETHL